MKLVAMLAVMLAIAAVLSAALDNRDSDRHSPGDWISEKDIVNVPDGLLIEGNIVLANVEETNSMQPVLNSHANALLMQPKDAASIKEGDVVVYTTNLTEGKIAHRILKIGEDEHGWYAVTKGDSAEEQDPEEVRFRDVKYVLVGVLY